MEFKNEVEVQDATVTLNGEARNADVTLTNVTDEQVEVLEQLAEKINNRTGPLSVYTPDMRLDVGDEEDHRVEYNFMKTEEEHNMPSTEDIVFSQIETLSEQHGVSVRTIISRVMGRMPARTLYKHAGEPLDDEKG